MAKNHSNTRQAFTLDALPTLNRLGQLEEAAKEILDYPIYFIQNGNGVGHIGEIARLHSGDWEARRYGSDYPNDCARYPDEHQALTFFFRE